jgi:hypothetical protein
VEQLKALRSPPTALSGSKSDLRIPHRLRRDVVGGSFRQDEDSPSPLSPACGINKADVFGLENLYRPPHRKTKPDLYG